MDSAKEGVTDAGSTPFTCPRCGHGDKEFHAICPECSRPYFRDYIDTQFYPRDPCPTGIYSGKFWAQVFLVLTLLGLVIHILGLYGII